MEGQVKCPKCLSTQISSNKKGFSGTKAVTGAILTGGIGLLAGTIGSNKVKITCLNCGHKFNPGDKPAPYQKPSELTTGGLIAIIIGIIGFLATFILIIVKVITTWK
jgi:hypothetical protein